MKEFGHNEFICLTRNFKINIFLQKFLSVNELDHDETARLARISKINIFIKNFISERVHP